MCYRKCYLLLDSSQFAYGEVITKSVVSVNVGVVLVVGDYLNCDCKLPLLGSVLLKVDPVLSYIIFEYTGVRHVYFPFAAVGLLLYRSLVVSVCRHCSIVSIHGTLTGTTYMHTYFLDGDLWELDKHE